MSIEKKWLLFILISFAIYVVQGSEEKKEDYLENINYLDFSHQELEVDSTTPEEFIEQKIIYYAPESGVVYLAWKIDDYPLEKCLQLNENTKLTDGLLYTPMAVYKDTFSIELKLPIDSKLSFYFWTFKNKQGQYVDFWDLQSSETAIVRNDRQINKKAVYLKKTEEKTVSYIISRGWLIFLFLSFVFALLWWVQKKRINQIEATAQINKILLLCLSFTIFQVFARAEIIGVNPFHVFNRPIILAKIVKASMHDFVYVIGLLALLTIPFIWFRNIKIRKSIYKISVIVILFSFFVAFTNIIVVVFLGKPLTYQWLYYSDFLGSREAITAIAENLSIPVIVNLLLLCLSMFMLAHVLTIACRLLAKLKYWKYIKYSILGIGLILIISLAFKTKNTWTKGQSENAILSFFTSMLNPNSNSTFFTADIPANMMPFKPARTLISDTLFKLPSEHNVKNVLFIVLESAGASYFDGYDGIYQLSPNLNKYASQALIFDQMYAYAPATNRTLVSILGAMYPYLSYRSITQEAYDMDYPTLSSVLKNKGYRTSFFSSANLDFQNSKQFLAYRQFDIVEDFSDIKCDEDFQYANNNYKEGNGIDDLCLADHLDSWLDEDSTKYFLSMIWTVQGHYPYFFAGEEEDFAVSDYNFNRYLNCMKHNDKLIGKVMQILDRKGLASSTLVVVTGDHGEAFGQHQQYGHGTAIYEENLKVPLYFLVKLREF